ncbi:MAG: phytanoyl-CoA dioxygenase family protein [Rhodospirillales bacterium]|nr:phytanoyl-CoA dioxygenase family protein [Rhodospirillales bacterium]
MPITLLSVHATYEHRGFAIVDDLISQSHCDALVEALNSAFDAASKRRGGMRNLFRFGLVRDLVRCAALRSIVESALSPTAFAVRAILFDKTPANNWAVQWHQDLTIAVNQRCELPGFGPWSLKDGVVHVQPPASVLQRMVTLRLHLDVCGDEDGALRVLPCSHRAGIVLQRPNDIQPCTCAVQRGGALLMSPLLWHSSPKAASPDHRRVIHVEFTDAELPPPLQWHEQV